MLLIASTTVSQHADAETLARGIIDARLAVCVQIEGPMTSFYMWEGRREESREFRLTIKLLPELAAPLEAWVQNHHPYEVPEWVTVRAENVSEKYLSWARTSPTNPPL